MFYKVICIYLYEHDFIFGALVIMVKKLQLHTMARKCNYVFFNESYNNIASVRVVEYAAVFLTL